MDYQIIIHSGGKGTRLYPYTKDKPKALVDVRGYALIQLSIQPFIDAGINKFIITASYKAKMIKDFFDQKELKIKFIKEPKPAGRAGAIRLGIEQGLLDPEKPAIITHADDIIKFNLNKIITAHESSGCIATLALFNSFQNPYGVAKINANKIIKFIEKPWIRLSKGGINTGLCVFSNLTIYKR